MLVSVEQLLASFKRHLANKRDARSLLQTVTELLGEELAASRVLALILQPGQSSRLLEWALTPGDPADDPALLALADRIHEQAAEQKGVLVLRDLREFVTNDGERKLLRSLELSSAIAICCHFHEQPRCTLILFREPGCDDWQAEELTFVEELGRSLGYLIFPPLGEAEAKPPGPRRKPPTKASASGADATAAGETLYRRLVENSDAIIFTTDEHHVIRFVSRRALDFFGVIPEDFVSGIAVEWFDLIHLDDRERVQRRAAEAAQTGSGFEAEFRVINHVTGRERWLLVKLVPVKSSDASLVGWDGFGVDITGRREAQEALDVQNRKVRALYTVSSAIRGYLDPANIAARGLRALCDATGAQAGLCHLYTSPRSTELALVAHCGFSAGFAERAESLPEASGILQSVAEKGHSQVISDLISDPRTKFLIDEQEGFRSAVLVPVAVEDEVFGALTLVHREVAKFDGGDVMLVAAAANQIGLAARQANLFAAYRKQTKNLSALYRMSHELSNLLTLEEVFQQAFTIIRDELGLKRLWLGLLDENGTRIVGQAAYGPGWKRRLVQMNVELREAENPVNQVIQSKKAMVVREPDDMLGQLGLKRFFSRFAIKAIGIAPLIARGQVLGVLAVQPGSGQPAMEEEEITLLSSLANEIAALILTKRLEERIAESEKMRSAGLLAAGVAHNFNNLLQAVLGQASLLEMQGKSQPQVLRAAKIISESATKGAGLVRQLLSFANLEDPHPASVNVNALLENELKNWTPLLKPNQQIKLSLKHDLARGFADSRHVVRIITTLLLNASDAMAGKGGPIQIFTDVISTAHDVAHVEVPEGTYVRIGVRDSGIGMDAETKRRCFEPFFTTKNVDPATGLSLSGAGLGLAAAYALARKNSGRLVVDSRLGQGSVFTLYIPVDGSKPSGKKTSEGSGKPKTETERGKAVVPKAPPA